MEQRHFRDGLNLSLLGFPGLMLVGLEQRDVDRLIGEAIEQDINYFDVAPSYGEGEAEAKLGLALEPFRDRVFLAGKTMQRDAGGARRELEESLRRLRTDRLDLYQFHALIRPEEVERIFGRGGAIEPIVGAREAGKVRYIGFSAHSAEAALLMLDRFRFDSVLFPVNFVCYAQGNWGPAVIRRAGEAGSARIALKAMALTRGRRWQRRVFPNCWYRPIEERDLAGLALRFALSEHVTAALPPSDASLFRLALEIARDFTPVSAEERAELFRRARGVRPVMKFR